MAVSLRLLVVWSTLVAGCLAARHGATVYDVLALVYRICSSEETEWTRGLKCVDTRFESKASAALLECLRDLNPSRRQDEELTVTEAVNDMCTRLTSVSEWSVNNPTPPEQLTMVITMSALSRMACVIETVKKPLTSWNTTFAECFPAVTNVIPLKDDKNIDNQWLDDGSKSRSGR